MTLDAPASLTGDHARPAATFERISQTRAAPSKDGRIAAQPTLTANHAAALQIAVQRGVGVAMMPSFVAARDLSAGSIEAVLTDWRLPELQVFAVYPHRRFLSPKVKVVVEALRAAFGDGSRDPWWPRSVGR